MLLKYYQKIDDAISYLAASFCNEKKLIKSVLRNKKITYVDIGTNQGTYLDFLSSFLIFKSIDCFEPLDDLCNQVKLNYPNLNIKTHKIALSNKSQIKNFYQYKISSQSSLYKQNDIFKSLKHLKKVHKVKTKKFDTIFNKSRKINFCKIDVQGEEINVLKGMQNNLKKKNISLIKIEISFISRYINSKPNFYEIINFMKKKDYYLTSISKIKFKNNKILLMDAFFEPN
tara:strand:+ start:471 stop:1157 length:687 start_codon:yes stop_codon:yes gene_type:complete